MTSRRSYRPLRRDLDKFLCAPVGEEINGIALSVLSALTRLGLDPWEEAGRLSSMAQREAAEQLARLIADLPGHFQTLAEAREIASRLVMLLPRHDTSRVSTLQIQMRPHFGKSLLPRVSLLWVICFVLAAAVLLSAFAQGDLPFGIGRF